MRPGPVDMFTAVDAANRHGWEVAAVGPPAPGDNVNFIVRICAGSLLPLLGSGHSLIRSIKGPCPHSAGPVPSTH